MNKSAAYSRLGLTGAEDPPGVTRAYTQQLTIAQEKLVSAQTVADRQQLEAQLAELTEAYEFLTETGRYTRAPADDSSATVMRSEGKGGVAGSAHDTLMRMETGAVLSSRLEIGALLGSGGMGNVYAARDRLKNEDVAIKVLRQDLLFSTAAKDRFMAEAKVSCNLSHPNIVRVYDVGLSGSHYYFSMERLQGHTLRQRLEAYSAQSRIFSVAEVTDIARQLIDALRYAHRYIVHRDLKPENIWLAEDGTVKLMDFGIARAYSNSQLTQTGMTLGTAYYMAPEQRIAAKEVDWRADQYALGVVLYELLTGAIPMGAVKPLDKARRDLPPRYAHALMRAMSPKPEDRWPSLSDLWAEIAAPPRKSISVAAVALIGLGIAATAAAGMYLVKERTESADTPMVAAGPERTGGVGLDAPATEEARAEEAPTQPDSVSAAGGQPPSNPIAGAQARQPPAADIEASSTDSQSQGTFTRSEPRATNAAPLQMAAIDASRNTRRQECVAQCERDNGECRSIGRRGRQECMRAVGFGGTGRITAATTTTAAAADCVFFGEARCRYASNPAACLNRMTTRYSECVATRNGSVAERRQDCEEHARDSERFCLDELRECRAYCE